MQTCCYDRHARQTQTETLPQHVSVNKVMNGTLLGNKKPSNKNAAKKRNDGNKCLMHASVSQACRFTFAQNRGGIVSSRKPAFVLQGTTGQGWCGTAFHPLPSCAAAFPGNEQVVQGQGQRSNFATVQLLSRRQAIQPIKTRITTAIPTGSRTKFIFVHLHQGWGTCGPREHWTWPASEFSLLELEYNIGSKRSSTICRYLDSKSGKVTLHRGKTKVEF